MLFENCFVRFASHMLAGLPGLTVLPSVGCEFVPLARSMSKIELQVLPVLPVGPCRARVTKCCVKSAWSEKILIKERSK